MDQSKALQRLTEAADLTGMLEELVKGIQTEKMSSSAVSGMKVTLKGIREAILSSHDALAAEIVSRSRARMEPTIQTSLSAPTMGASMTNQKPADPISSALESASGDGARLGMRRRDLRSTIEHL